MYRKQCSMLYHSFSAQPHLHIINISWRDSVLEMILPGMFEFNTPSGKLFSALISLIDNATKKLEMREKKTRIRRWKISLPTLLIRDPGSQCITSMHKSGAAVATVYFTTISYIESTLPNTATFFAQMFWIGCNYKTKLNFVKANLISDAPVLHAARNA